MADLRIPASSALTPVQRPAVAPARAQSARAAQKAFFDAALGQTTTTTAGTATASVATTGAVSASRAVTVAQRPPVFDPNMAPPSRLLRPGSLVDITV